MTAPEENAPKSRSTDQVLPSPDEQAEKPPEARPTLGAELADTMAENGIDREDFNQE